MVVGDCLGAGKTTALVRLAKSRHDEGKRVGLITDDSATGLVDAGTIRVQGFRVEEVAGA
jgi:G3E family GTPase